MKKSIFVTISISIFFLNACKIKSPEYKNIADQISYAVNLDNQNEALPILENMQSKEFIDGLLKSIENKKVQAYKYSLKEKYPISFQDVKANFDAVNKITIIDNEEQVIKRNILSQEIKDIIFLENWKYDSKSSEITKEVKALSAVRSITNEINDTVIELRQNIPFMIYFNESSELSKSAKLICPRAEYAVKLHKCDSLFTTFAKLDSKTLVKTMIDNVLNKNITVYDFFDEEKKKLSIKDIKENFDASDKTIEVEDEKTGDFIKQKIKNEINLEEIVELVFVEEWYYDEVNFTFFKKIIAYGPVREYINARNTKVQTVPFLIYQ